MSTEKTQQGYIISMVHNGYREKMHYIGYNKRDCLAMFKAYIASL